MQNKNTNFFFEAFERREIFAILNKLCIFIHIVCMCFNNDKKQKARRLADEILYSFKTFLLKLNHIYETYILYMHTFVNACYILINIHLSGYVHTLFLL